MFGISLQVPFHFQFQALRKETRSATAMLGIIFGLIKKPSQIKVFVAQTLGTRLYL